MGISDVLIMLLSIQNLWALELPIGKKIQFIGVHSIGTFLFPPQMNRTLKLTRTRCDRCTDCAPLDVDFKHEGHDGTRAAALL